MARSIGGRDITWVDDDVGKCPVCLVFDAKAIEPAARLRENRLVVSLFVAKVKKNYGKSKENYPLTGGFFVS